MRISNVNIDVDRDKCIACGQCVDRCIMDNLRLSVAPCRQACPLDLNCQGYLRLLAMGKGEDAAAELRKYTPFAAILGRVCSQPCEAACERNTVCHDGAVHIRAVKRYLADAFPAVVNALSEKAADTGRHVAIVGSGPAGLMAAHELAAQGHAVTLYEAAPKAGGMLRYGAPAYRLSDGVMDEALRQVTGLGVTIVTGKRLGKELSLDRLREKYDAVLLAVGLWDAIRPAIPGADLPGVYDALQVLRAAREGGFKAEVRSAAVVGGGSTAMDVALTLKKLGVPDVRVVALESERDMPIAETDRIEAAEEGVVLQSRWAVEGVRKDGRGLVLDIRRCLAVFNDKGEFAPELDPETARSMTTDMLVFAIGQKLRDGLGAVPHGAGNLLAGHEQTGQLEGMEDVFVAGDCVTGASSVVHAMASGQRVARCMHRYLTGRRPLAIDTWAETGKVRDHESVPERSNGVPRGVLERLPVAARNMTAEVELVLAPERARTEAQRCMSCGRAYEANRTCWYCLPCEIECPQEALSVKMPYLVR